MRIVITLICVLVPCIILAVVFAELLIRPEGASSSQCLSCHKLDTIGKFTTTGIPISNEYAWQTQLHQALSEPDCVSCHTVHGNELRLFQHELLTMPVRENCSLCHSQSVPDDIMHSSISSKCGTCHSTETGSGAFLEHDQFFTFDSRHPPTCGNCHMNESDFSQYSCYGCHEHSEEGIRREHLEEGIRNYYNCVQCHRSGNQRE